MDYQRVGAEIYLDNIANNIKEIRKFVAPKTKIMAVVKADAYGHGALEVSKVALYNGADYLGVAICDEALALRRSNILVPILILGNTVDSQIDDVIKNDITQTIFSYEMAKKFSNEGKKLGKLVKIHIKIDTGMGRIGFIPDDKAIEEIVKISKLDNIHIEGIFTHFATADCEDRTFTIEQHTKFVEFCNRLNDLGLNNLIRHSCNSAGTLNFPEFHLDMVRVGVILYGLYPSDYTKRVINLKPCMTVKTQISHIKTLYEGNSLGYGRTYFTSKETKVATIPLGYADGYARSMSNKSRVIINNNYAFSIGRICMDQMMVDITHLEDVKPFDEVIIMGSSESCEVTSDELANLQGTINYEIVCSVGKRVPRIYIKNGETLKTINYNF